MVGFGIRSDERVALFFDGQSVYSTSKNLGFDIDYRKLSSYFESNCRLVRSMYYTTVQEDQEHSTIRPLLDWLDYNKYHVRTKPSREQVDSLGRRKVKGNILVEMTVDMIEIGRTVDHVILFTGDGDYLDAVQYIQRQGKRVTVVSTVDSSATMVNDDLRRQADSFVDFIAVKDLIRRDIGHREMNSGERLPESITTPRARRTTLTTA